MTWKIVKMIVWQKTNYNWRMEYKQAHLPAEVSWLVSRSDGPSSKS